MTGYANTSRGIHVRPGYSGERGTCELCNGEMVARCGEIMEHHWAHLNRPGDCDAWSEGATSWHLAHQSVVPHHRREVPRAGHRADMISFDKRVVEIQHSTLSVDQIRCREAVYGRGMVWIFDAREAYARDRLNLRQRPERGAGAVTFRWKQPRKSISAAKSIVFLDLGEGGLLRVDWMGDSAPYGGKGYTFETASIWRWISIGGGFPRPVRLDFGYDDRVARAAAAIPDLVSDPADRDRLMAAAFGEP